MNFLTWVILFIITALQVLDGVASVLNLKSFAKNIPAEFKGIYDEKSYQKLREYTAANTGFSLVDSIFELFVLIAFWFAGGFEWLDGVVRGFHWGPIESGIVYIGALGVGRMMLSMPFNIYHTFLIEQRFGFNKTTPAIFVADTLKGLLLSAILGGPLLGVVLALFQYAGPYAWVYCWASISVMMIVLAYVAPAIIMPMFNKFQTLEEGDLRDAIVEYGRANQFPIGGIFTMDGSKRSTKANAFLTGFGSMKKIVLFDTLIRNHTIEELVAVLAHEVGHFKLRHVVRHLALEILNIGFILFLASLFIRQPALSAAFGIHTVSVYCGLALFLLVCNPLIRITSVLTGFQARADEFSADRFAIETTRRGTAMIDALKKLSRNNLSNPTPHPLVVILHHSHPPLMKRIQAIRDVWIAEI